MTINEMIHEIPHMRYRLESAKHKETLDEIEEVLRQLKDGHWIDHQEGRWIYAKCSECGTIHDTQTAFCPACGAKMESEVE